jgi:hypothetical protein
MRRDFSQRRISSAPANQMRLAVGIAADVHHSGRSRGPASFTCEPHIAVADCTRTQMRKITLFAVAAAIVASGVFGVWAVSPINARAPSTGQGIEPVQLMMNAKGLPTVEFADYTFVY